MNNPLRTAEDYELFLYTLAEQYPSIERSTVSFQRRGRSLARVTGEIFFARGLRLVVSERIVYDRLPAVLDWYGYEIWQHQEKLYWYDPQPHPDDPSLQSTHQSTHPHHRHLPPDIKHNRVPAPGISFVRPNLPRIIEEIEDLIRSQISADN